MHLYTTYLANITHEKILIIGPASPPIGGISIHVERTCAQLKLQHNTVTTLSISYKGCSKIYACIKLVKTLLYIRPNRIYYHTLFLRRALIDISILILFSVLFKNMVITVDHDCIYLYTRSKLFKYIFKSLLQHVTQRIVIGTSTAASYTHNNIILPYTIDSAFLPPDITKEQEIIAEYPPSLFTFIAAHATLIVANATHFSLTKDTQQDIYGLDLCIHALANIRIYFPSCGLVIALADTYNTYANYTRYLMPLLNQYQLHAHVYFLTGQYQLWPLIKKASVFLRPTRHDSFGISVAEALFFGIPVIASNVCKRPTGTIILSSNTITALTQTLRCILAKRYLI